MKVFLAHIILLLTSITLTAQTITWTREFSFGWDIQSVYIEQTHDGCYLLTSALPHYMYFVLKLGPDGGILWTRQFDDGAPYNVVALEDNSLLVTGFARGTEGRLKDGFIQRIDSTGNSLWKLKLGKGMDNSITDVLLSESGTALCLGVVGNSFVPNDKDYLLFSIDNDGDTSDFRKIPVGSCFKKVPRFHNMGSGRILISGGQPVIINNEGDSIKRLECGLGTFVTADSNSGSLYFLERINFESARLIKTDSNSALQWKSVLAIESRFTYFENLLFHKGSIFVCGFSSVYGVERYNGTLIKVNETGNISWVRYYPVREIFRGTFFNMIISCADNGYACSGIVSPPVRFGEFNMFVVKTDSNGYAPSLTTNILDQTVNSINSISAYPNPFNNNTTVSFKNEGNSPFSLEVFDVSGKLIFMTYTATRVNDLYEVSIRSDLWPSGVYFVALRITDIWRTSPSILKILHLK